jgi:osmotically-inducible protein OsmY
MRDNRKIVAAALAVALFTGLAGCASPTFHNATQSAGKVFEIRSSSDQAEDAAIAARFAARLAEIASKLHLDVGIDVWEQRVMLTGVVVDAKTREAVIKAVRVDRAVKLVYDDLQIVSKAARDRRRHENESGNTTENEGSLGNDRWIEAKVRGKLVTAYDVRSVNFRWRAVLGHVSVIGTARNPDEEKHLLAILRETKNVKAVKPHIDKRTTSAQN